MRIKKITPYILKVPLGKERFYSSQCAFPERNSLLVKVETEDGIVGWGEGGQYGPAEPVMACINSVLAPQLLGMDPRERTKLWSMMYANTRDFGQKGTYIEAISAIDIALWDITGQSVGLPVYLLLGGCFRQEITAYATGCYYRGEDYLDIKQNLNVLMEEAKSYKDAGFKILKIKLGLLSIEQDIERVRAIRHAIGDEMKLMVDCNHAYNAFNAVKVAKELEQLGVILMEEPVVPEDHDGYKMVRSKTTLAIAGGEAEYTRYGFERFINGGCADIIQPDLCVSGGFSEWINILALAHTKHVMAIPHVWGSAIALAAALHAIASTPCLPHTANPVPMQNEPVVEYDKNFNPLRDDLLTSSLKFKNGKLHIPHGPGLGVSVDMAKLERYLVET
jgi:D-galactarolactone cycloisomerase